MAAVSLSLHKSSNENNVTSYDVRGDGQIEAHTKFDVTDQVVALASDVARVARIRKKSK